LQALNRIACKRARPPAQKAKKLINFFAFLRLPPPTPGAGSTIPLSGGGCTPPLLSSPFV